MRDDEKIFKWGIFLLGAMFVIGAALQVCSRAQGRSLSHARAGIVKTQQEIADATTRFSALVRQEVLHAIADEVHPAFETIGFKKNVRVMEIPMKKGD
jgi:hypothetical protein